MISQELDLTSSKEAAILIMMERASQPWSPDTHRLWPEAARAHACELIRLGHLLANIYGSALVDVWRGFVMPHVLRRGDFEADSAAACVKSELACEKRVAPSY